MSFLFSLVLLFIAIHQVTLILYISVLRAAPSGYILMVITAHSRLTIPLITLRDTIRGLQLYRLIIRQLHYVD